MYIIFLCFVLYRNVGRLSQVETFTRPRATLESEVLAVQIALEHGNRYQSLVLI